MKSLVALLLLGLLAQAMAEPIFETENAELQEEARFLYFNTSSTATSLTLLGALILLGVIAYLVYAGGLLGSSSGYNRTGYEQQYYDGYEQNPYAQYRSNDEGYNLNPLTIISWINMFQEMYNEFDYNDLECQKKLICEVMSEPEHYGSAALKMKTGFKYARYLEAFAMPDDLQQLLDEYLDANERADQHKDCSEVFECPYSIRDSLKRSFTGNSL